MRFMPHHSNLMMNGEKKIKEKKKRCAKLAMNCAELTFTATEQDVQEEEEEEMTERRRKKFHPRRERNSVMYKKKRKKHQQVFSVFTALHGAAFVKFYWKCHIRILWCTLKMTDYVTNFRGGGGSVHKYAETHNIWQWLLLLPSFTMLLLP